MLATEIRPPGRRVYFLHVAASISGLCDVSALLKGRISVASTVDQVDRMNPNDTIK